MRNALLTLAAICVAIGGLVSSASALAPAEKPNVIFVITDDLGYGDLGAYGQEKIKTPNIDRLAADGMLFTQHYSGSPVCGPSRSCLMTGQHTGRTAIRTNPRYARGWPKGQGDFPLPDGAGHFPLQFKNAGYATAAIGKWGLGRPGTSGAPQNQGFDYFFGYADHGHAHDYYPKELWRGSERFELEDKQYSHDLIAAEALEFVRKQKDNPFFLYFSITIPHARLQVPSDQPYSDQDWPQPEKNFAAMITRMDGDIGKLVSLLKELKLDEKTMIVFTSDNGPHSEGKHDPDFFNSNGPLRGIKRDVYEGGIRVPMIVRWPGKVAAGKKSDHISANWDFVPTFAALLGTEPPKNTDGISMLPTLLGSGEQPKHQYLYWEFNERGGKQGLRMGDFKAVRTQMAKNADGPLELYNLAKDIGETNNIADKHPDIVKKIEKLMAEAYVPTDQFERWSGGGQGTQKSGQTQE